MLRKSAFEVVLASCAIVAVAIGAAYFRDTYPLPGNRGELSREAIKERCQTLLDTLGIAVNDLEQTLSLETNKKLLAYAQMTFGTASANHLFANDLPAYYWRVRYRRAFDINDIFTSSKESEEKKVSESLQKYVFGETAIHFDLHGRVLRFSTGFDSTRAQAAGDSATAMSKLNMLRLMSPFADEEVLEQPRFEKIRGATFNDFLVSWAARVTNAGVRASIKARVRSDKLTAWEVAYEPMHKISLSDKSVRSLLAPFSYIGVVLCLAIFFFRKLRADQISLRAGLPTGILCAVATMLSFLLLTTESFVERMFPAVLAPVGLILGFMLVYGVSESVMRDRGADRLLSFEALQRRNFLFKPAGDSLVRGVMLGAVAFGVVTLIIHQFGHAVKYYVDFEDSDARHYLSLMPALSFLGVTFSNVVFSEVTFRLFAISFFQRYFRSLGLVALLSATLAATAKMHLMWLQPMGFMLAVNFLISMLLSFAYLRYDFLTSLTAALTVQLLYVGMSLFYFPAVHSALQASLLLAVPVVFLVGGAAVRRYGSDKVDVRALEPDYVQRLAERERMARELEIARQVQQSFLPREIPVINGLDIASLCVPANEVGGDYYDFIPFSPKRLGVIIGDVSGKGISAAFYMTLTKGIVKTLVREGLAPGEVLIRANQLFYENAERSIFVSLVFGIFDLQKKVFTFARAGHNPVIIASSDLRAPQIISPPGIALGLESGEVFARTMIEKTVAFSAGDLFVFYTDGFTEAMNNGKDEFGESRFAEVLREFSKESSAALTERLRTKVRTFAGQALQHDDMTVVVVRVL